MTNIYQKTGVTKQPEAYIITKKECKTYKYYRFHRFKNSKYTIRASYEIKNHVKLKQLYGLIVFDAFLHNILFDEEAN